jgi:hypothetical protein
VTNDLRREKVTNERYVLIIWLSVLAAITVLIGSPLAQFSEMADPDRMTYNLFTRDTHFVVYMNAKDPTPSQELHSREALAPVFAELNQYDATTHFVGQSTIFTLTDERATGEAYCLAHHVTVEGNKRGLMLASLRYLDTFTKVDGSWLFAERQLYVDWLEQRAMS